MSKPKPFWKHHPQEHWTEIDWRAWDKAGRPRVPVGLRLSAKLPPKRLDNLEPIVPPSHPFTGFDLYAKPKPRGQSARSASIDRLLEKLGVRAK